MTPTPERLPCDVCGHAWLEHDEMGCNACPRVDLGDGIWANADCRTQTEVVIVSLRGQLAASQERVRELEAENVALRANTSASVVRRLVEQGALRGPESPA